MSSGMSLGPDTIRLGRAPARLEVRALGTFSVRHGQRIVELNGRKARALVGYLALVDGHRETRDRLVGLFWSETDEARARASLRQTVYEVREAFQRIDQEGVTADRLTVALASTATHVDLVDVVEHAKAGRAHPLLLESERPIDALFADLEAIDPAFNVWLLTKRQTYADRITTGLQDALRRDCEDIERVARALLNLDPTNEEAARALIRARVAVGDTGGALGVYKTLWELLEQDYDTEPSKETQDLIAEVKLGSTVGKSPAPIAAPAPTPTTARLIVALGGFDTSGTSEKHRYLIHGFRQELIASLVRFREWVVRDQAGLEAGATRPGADAGEYVIDASAFEGARGLRLLIMLRDAKSNDYLWSERIELSIENWFDAQQTIVRRLAAALSVYVSIERLEAAAAAPQENLLAYDLWLRSQSIMHRFDSDNWRHAITQLEDITKSAPRFAPAFSSLSQIDNAAHIAIPGVFRSPAMAERSLEFARKAAALDPVDSRSQLCLGWALILAGQFEQGYLHHDLALDLNENDPWTLMSTALSASFGGNHDSAATRASYAIDLLREPTPNHWGYLAQINFLREDYDGSAHAAVRASGPIHFLGWNAAACAHLGELDRAQDFWTRFVTLAKDRWRGDTDVTDASIARWFLHCFPIRHRTDWERLRTGVGLAGGVTDELEYLAVCLTAKGTS